MLREFLDFLKKYSVVGLAIAVIIGGKVNEFVSASVSDILMPLIGAVLPRGEWKTWTLDLGTVKLGLGHWFGSTIDFAIVAFIVFMTSKLLIRETAQQRNK